MERSHYLGGPWPKCFTSLRGECGLQKFWASDGLDTHVRKGLLLGGRWLPFINNPVGVQAQCPHSLVRATLFQAVLAVGQEEQHMDLAFALLSPFICGCYLPVGFLVQGTGYCFIDVQHK